MELALTLAVMNDLLPNCVVRRSDGSWIEQRYVNPHPEMLRVSADEMADEMGIEAAMAYAVMHFAV